MANKQLDNNFQCVADVLTTQQRLAAQLSRAWQGRGALAQVLRPVSWAYGGLVCLRRQMFAVGLLKAWHAQVPVIVVGNVVAGGAGKTPLVMAMVMHLKAQGLQVGVVSRGYGRNTLLASLAGVAEVLPSTPAAYSGDEPLLIKRATGVAVFVGVDRVQAAQALLAAYPHTQCIVSDDGLQHYALGRCLEVAVFDDRGIGNGWLLPAGPLREPWPARRRAGIDLVLHTGQTPAFEGYRASRRLADYAINRFGETVPLNSLQSTGQHVAALAATANPSAFFSMLQQRGLVLSQTLALPDHFDFANFDALGLMASTLGHSENLITVLCTEKDAVKLFALPIQARVNVLAVPLKFSPEAAFWNALDDLLKPVLQRK